MSVQMTSAARVAVLMTAAVLTAAGCGASPTAAPGPGGPTAGGAAAAPRTAAPVRPPRVSGFDYTDPARVCHRFVAALYSADTTRDAGPADAFTRAAAYATAALAGQDAAAARDGRWATWVSHHARLNVEVSAHIDLHPEPDSSVEAVRAVRVAVTPYGGDGWRGWTEHSLIYCTLHVGDSGEPGWRVAHYDIHPAGL